MSVIEVRASDVVGQPAVHPCTCTWSAYGPLAEKISLQAIFIWNLKKNFLKFWNFEKRLQGHFLGRWLMLLFLFLKWFLCDCRQCWCTSALSPTVTACLKSLYSQLSSDRLTTREYQLGKALQAWNNGDLDLGMTLYEDHVRCFPTGEMNS